MRQRLGMMGMLLAGAFTAGWAGSNASAVLYIDLDCATPQIDSASRLSLSGSGSDPFWVGVRIADAKYLDSYGFQLAYDTSKLAFVRAVAAIPEQGYANFLETRGGSAPLFIGKLSVQDSSRVAIGNSLAGSDSTKSPGGSGFLALIQFRPLSDGQARFGLEEAQLLDWNRDADAPASVHGATLIMDRPSALRGGNAAKPYARWKGRSLELELGDRAGTLRIADAQGKDLFRREGLRGKQTIDLPFAGHGADLVWLQTADEVLRLPVPAGR